MGIKQLKDGTIQLDILNKGFFNTTRIKKYQEIGYMFFRNQRYNQKIVTLYNNID